MKEAVTITKKICEIDYCLKEFIQVNKKDFNPGLLGGHTGISLFFYLNYLHSNDEDSLKFMENILVDAFQSINDFDEGSPFFCNGVSGLAYLMHFYADAGILERSDLKHLAPVDKYLYESFKDSISSNNFDFLHGGEGLLNYFLYKKAEGTTKYGDLLNLYLDRLNDTKDKISNNRIGWKSNVKFEDDYRYVYNLGLAHGMTSTIIMLSKIIKMEELKSSPVARDLLNGVLEFFFSEKLGNESLSTFPFYSSLSMKPQSSRLGWCYGDLGIAIAIWKAGEALQDPAVKQEAVDICLKTIKRRAPHETGVLDAGICHGSAGVCLSYKSMFYLTGLTEFKEASDYWADYTLKLGDRSEGLSGFQMYTRDGYKNEVTILDGIAGIGLLLLTCINPKEIKWTDSLLLAP